MCTGLGTGQLECGPRAGEAVFSYNFLKHVEVVVNDSCITPFSHWPLQTKRCSPIRIMWILAVVNFMSPAPKLPWHLRKWEKRRYKKASTSSFNPNPNLKRTHRYRASQEQYRARRCSRFWWTIWPPKMPPTHPRGNFAGDHGLDQR